MLTENHNRVILITVLHNTVIDGGKQLAKQREGVYERIIECARKEFLEKGYMDASLRTIATQAGTTTGSIYTRFKDKEGLFEAIVGPHYDHIMSRFCRVQEEFAALPAEQQPENMGKVSGNCMLEILQYCYEHIEECQMLISKAEGTRYASFLDELVEIESKATHKYLQVLEHLGNSSPPISPRLEHIIITGMFNTYLELVLHQMPWEEAVLYLEEMQAFYTAGWMKLMGQE
jgi:AcrR family transcriptional regulator